MTSSSTCSRCSAGRTCWAREPLRRPGRGDRPRASWPRWTGWPAGPIAESLRRRPTATRRCSTPRPLGADARAVQEVVPGLRWTREWYRLELPAGLGGTGAPRSLAWVVAELILGANPAVWMYASGPRSRTALWQHRHPGAAAVRRAGGRARVGRDDGADRAGRRLGRRRRPDQGDRAAGRHLAHRGRQAVHHQRRARHGGEHLPPGAGPARGRRPGHQGPVDVPGAQVPGQRRRHARRAQRRLRHRRRAQDGAEGLDHLRAHLRRASTRRSAPWSAACTTASGRCS